ncbi:MAG: response regulator [Fuerstiella sp.]
MTHQNVLIVDDKTTSHETIQTTLDDAQLNGIFTDSTTNAWKIIQEEDVSLVLLRGIGAQLESEELCRKIRTLKAAEDCSVIVILTEADLPQAAGFLIAGANDLLVEPFEPRELRMRAVIVPADQVRRVDQAHVVNGGQGPKLIVPELNPQTLRMDFGYRQHEVPEWEADPNVRKVALDTVCACPECESIASFRPGCGSCGSAFLEKQNLIHHYACAHVGPENEFRPHDASDLSCPKCRMKNLVSGADFEVTEGCLVCRDCDALTSQPASVGHCMSCQHRFLAADAKIITVYGYQFGRAGAQATIPAPNYQSITNQSTSTAFSEGH